MSKPASGATTLVRALVVGIGLLLAGLLLVDWNALFYSGGPQETDDAQLRGDPSLIEAETAGLVTDVLVDDDQPVKRGQTLFRIERDFSEVAVREARALRDRAAAEILLEEARLAAANDAVGGERKRADAERALLLFARQDAARWNGLRGTPGDLLRARQSANADEADRRDTVEADERRVAAAEASAAAVSADLSAARGTLAAAEAELANRQIELRWTDIVAPADGVVTERAAFRGEYVRAGDPLTRFVPLPRVWAVAWYREEQVPAMRVGQHVSVHVDAFPGLSIAACVESIAPLAQDYDQTLPPDQATGNFTKVVQRVPVKITFRPPTDPVLRRGLIPGLNVETFVHTAGPADCVPEPGL